MKLRVYLNMAVVLLSATALAYSTFANEEPHTADTTTAAVDNAEAVAAYPLTTCVVSGDKLEDGDMGPPINYIFKQEGKPDRLVRLCCKGCIKDFKKDPDKYLKIIDDAAAKKAGSAKVETDESHAGHTH
ncbi:MAG TPA: hypothetical protein PJ991_05820 [Kiritimatiellia bacterium]|nr:hypothetical protein [Kiritimatiellia bacterium]